MPSQGSLSDRAINQRLRKLAAEINVPAYDLLRVAGTPAGLHHGFHHLLVTPYPRTGSTIAIPLPRRPGDEPTDWIPHPAGEKPASRRSDQQPS